MFTLERTLHTSLVVNLGVRTLQGILRETIRESRMFLQIPLFSFFFSVYQTWLSFTIILLTKLWVHRSVWDLGGSTGNNRIWYLEFCFPLCKITWMSLLHLRRREFVFQFAPLCFHCSPECTNQRAQSGPFAFFWFQWRIRQGVIIW